ncbi:PAS domain-containing protein [Methylomonas sp. LL1]|uniref:PAS domain-containing protein n=1 Tax=Methylomonas sp. LL1 TaxID=2785785 RepID=UPI0018C42FD3|nr:PAS domain-containing protein [Methylomonas sp. LL1]QPK63610.1 PAS domain-containing protein [Methylomonas sp. LL1]
MVTHSVKTQAILDYVDGQPVWVRYGLAFLAVSAAAVATFYIPVLGLRAPFLLFFFAIIQATFWFGLHQGIFAMLLSLFVANSYFLIPLCISTPDDIVVLNIGFCILSAVMIATTGFHRRLTKTLRDSRYDLNHAQAVGQIGSWRMNVQANELYWSDQNHRIFGIPKGTPMSYETFLGCVHPDDLEYVDRMWRACLRGEPYDIEHRLMVAGELKWVREKAELEFDRNGQLIGAFGTTQDISRRKQAEEQLKESQRLLAESQAIAHIGSWTVDMASGRVNWSEEGLRLYGIVSDSHLNLTFEQFLALLDAEHRPAMRAWVESCAAGDNPAEIEFRVHKPDGSIRWLQGRGKLETGPDGEAVRMVGTVQDITELKQAMEVVRAGEAFVRDLLNSLPEHVVLLDQQGKVTSVNEPWERFAREQGGSVCELSVGANYLDVCRRWSAAGDSGASKALNGLESLFAGQRQEFFMEYPCPTADGLLWFLMHAKRVNHSFEGVIITHLDITEHKAAEIMLRETEARLALTVEAVHAAYWDWDLETQALYLSPEWKQQIGFDEHELANCWDEWESRLHPEDRDMVVTATENYIAGGQQDYELEFRLRHKDGSYRWIHARGGLLRDQANHPYRMLGINLDVTEYMKSRELAQRRDKMEHSFRLSVATQTASAIAHELNQPLTAINSYADVALKLLQIGSPDPQKLAHVLESCGQQARRAAEVIRQLLDQLQQTKAIREAVDINLSVKEALEFILRYKEFDAFQIELELAIDLPLVMANSLQVQKVLLNLIGNGLEAMRERGEDAEIMTVSTRRAEGDPDMVQVTVCDSGKGVADGIPLRTLFQPFYTTKSTGLGMGLAISRSLIQSFGGSMWAERNADSGLSIHFTLPFAK